MKTRHLAFALLAAISALPVTALAQEAEEEASAFSWNLALTSDYIFRGVSQTEEKPAFQVGADFAFGPGFYVGAWASNVDFGTDGPWAELDTYVGWNGDLSDAWNLDLMLNRYNYYGAEDSFGDGDYNEFIGVLTYAEAYSFTLGYTNDIYGLDEDSFYYALGGSWDIGHEISLGAGVGLTTFEQATGYEDYMDWSVSLSRDFGAVNVALGYYGTDSDGDFNFGDAADDRVVLTFSIGG